jgi:hypothetical protein
MVGALKNKGYHDKKETAVTSVPQFLSSEAEQLLASAPASLPLTKNLLPSRPDASHIRTQNPAVLFPGARDGRAALAGLLLRLGCWSESHSVAQTIYSTEGSYWHAIVHRIEPDSANAAYWFRRVGKHEIFPRLLQRAREILEKHGPRHWRLKSTWDPLLFLEWCEEARLHRGQAEVAAIEMQMSEWELLFNWCLTAEAGS